MSRAALRPPVVNYHDTCHHKTFYLSCDDFDGLLDFAHRCCQICGLPEAEAKRGRLIIDHAGDYGFMAVRGLLCDKCNSLMRRVDAREVSDNRASAYCQQAWFARLARQRFANRPDRFTRRAT